MKRRLDYITSTSTIGNIWMQDKERVLNLKPEYQRNYVWSDDFKCNLIYSIVKNYPIGNITLRRVSKTDENKFNSEVVDGQQRLTTIFDFLNNDFSVFGASANDIFQEIKSDYTEFEKDKSRIRILFNKFKNNQRLELKFELFPERTRTLFQNYNLSISTINDATNIEVSTYFRFVQNQERLRAGEIINSFIDSPLDRILESNCELDRLMSVFGFDNSRKEFNKLYAGVIGVLVDKINFGSKDSDIIDFVKELEFEQIPQNIYLIAQKISEKLGVIAKINTPIKTNKRYVKLLMLLIGLEEKKQYRL